MKFKFSKDSLVETLTEVGFAILGAGVSKGVVSMLPENKQTPLYRGALAAATAVGGSMVGGEGTTPSAIRSVAKGMAIYQGLEAVRQTVATKVQSENKFVQGVLNGAADYLPAYQPEAQYTALLNTYEAQQVRSMTE